jgi:hypothetical protein
MIGLAEVEKLEFFRGRKLDERERFQRATGGTLYKMDRRSGCQ